MTIEPIGFRFNGDDYDRKRNNGDGEDFEQFEQDGIHFPELNIFVTYADLLKYAAFGLYNTLTLQRERVMGEVAHVNHRLAALALAPSNMANFVLQSNLAGKGLQLHTRGIEIDNKIETLRTEIAVRGW